MKTRQFGKWLAVGGLVWGLAGCASDVKRVDLPDSANVNDEISTLEKDLQTAVNNQVDVASPKNFAAAAKDLAKAKRENASNGSSRSVLNTVGEGKGYLAQAQEKAAVAAAAFPDIVKAREAAMTAQARTYNGKELSAADDKFKDLSAKGEAGKDMTMSPKDRDALQLEYLNVELGAIKTSKLSQASAMIDDAVKKGAAKLAPKSLNNARNLYRRAEIVIGTDRHDGAAIDQAVDKANQAAQKLVKITDNAKGAKSQSPEDIALIEDSKDTTISSKDAALKTADTELSDSERQARAKTQSLNDEIAAQAAHTGAITAENAELTQKEKFNQTFQEAQQAFKPEEAEVSRQGDQLVIRLKSMNFKSGRSEVSGDSFPVLNKVKDVLTAMNAEKVTVAGNTDSIGGQKLNQKLSEDRAKAVAKYLVSTDAIKENQVSAVGYGDEKPLASNKTKAGRAENRRVDVIITPGMVQ